MTNDREARCRRCGGAGLIAPDGWTRPCPDCRPEKYAATRPLSPAIQAFLEGEPEPPRSGA